MEKTRGIIIAVPEKYQSMCYKNLLKIRFEYKIDYPIEIWQIGQEITPSVLTHYQNIPNIYFREVPEPDANDPTQISWKGFQVKAYIFKHTDFDEVLLLDADITIFQNPTLLFDDPGYKKTGTYFFRDLTRWKYENLTLYSHNNFNSLQSFNRRKQFVRHLLPVKSQYFPKEWDYIYDEDPPKDPVLEAYQESGIVVFDRSRNKDAVNNIYELNRNHAYTYKYILGDKETFWMGCLQANTEFTMNSTEGYMSSDNKLSHDYDGAIFFQQK
jgi:hypothetical protein